VGIVVRVGFNTTKGAMLRDVAFPKPITHFTFYQDSLRFIYVLFFIAMLGFIVCFIFLYNQGKKPDDIIMLCLDLFTIIIPPALPAALMIGTIFAVKRLKT
jgi:cation-transporting ATPase 13A2